MQKETHTVSSSWMVQADYCTQLLQSKEKMNGMKEGKWKGTVKSTVFTAGKGDIQYVTTARNLPQGVSPKIVPYTVMFTSDPLPS